VPLSLNPGLSPIGVGVVLRRIIGTVVIRTFKRHIQESVGPLQLCGGQKVVFEAMDHVFSSKFEEEDCDAVLFIDADNAFNRKMMVHNV